MGKFQFSMVKGPARQIFWPGPARSKMLARSDPSIHMYYLVVWRDMHRVWCYRTKVITFTPFGMAIGRYPMEKQVIFNTENSLFFYRNF